MWLLLLILLIIIILAVTFISSKQIIIAGLGGVGAAVIEMWPIFGGLPKLANLIIIEPKDIEGHPVLTGIKKP